eukprot:m.75727 g.75727  ORF g.75727 m.75727 type:complete len:195 (+) comp16183_c0_seq2:1350-1934(+)
MMTWVRNADGCVVGSQDANISNTAFYPPDWQSGGGVIDRHGSFFSLHGQTYFACNDRSHGGNAHFRSTVIVYVNYFRNGTIAPIRIDDTGVGEYNLSADAPIEAEDFFRVAGSARKDEKVTGDGFEVANITDGSTLKYSNAHADSAGAYTLHVCGRWLSLPDGFSGTGARCTVSLMGGVGFAVAHATENCCGVV